MVMIAPLVCCDTKGGCAISTNVAQVPSPVVLPPIPGPYQGKRVLLNPMPEPQIPVNPPQIGC